MATVEGLNQRGSRWYLLVLTPKDLQASYGGKTKRNIALDTSDKAEAVRKGLRLRAQWLDDFETKRKALNPQVLEAITPELVQVLADGARKKVLQADQHRREGNDPILRMLSLVGLPLMRAADGSIPLPKRKPMEGLTDRELSALTILNDTQSQETGRALAGLNLRTVLPLLQEDARALGHTITEETEGLKEALQAYLRSYRQAWLDASRRDTGELIDEDVPLPLTLTPQTSTGAPVASPVQAQGIAKSQTLRDIYDLWLRASPKTKDTAQACSRSLDSAEECLGSPLYVQQVARDQGNTFKAWLQEPDRGISPKTARDRLMYVNSLLKFACVELEAIQKNPWQGLSIEDPKTSTRRPWKDEELRQLFSQPLFQAYEVPPEGRTGGGPAAYWIPIIGLYTGARIGELAQLRVSDITEEDGIPIIKITDEGEDQKVKTSASRRSLPIHSELIRLGLLDYAEDVRKQDPNGSLWPLLKSANTASAWFSKYRKSIGLNSRWLDFHSFRHTVRTRLNKAQVQEQVQDAITGHETGGSTGRKVYTRLDMEDLQKAIQTLSYGSISLPRVYFTGKLTQDA
ncbi:site-specific integrase [Comamonas terrigena]|uniref:site-specific integrase n=1 Tax=Comamonas terrigena TaxID=32013 RepID=UPI0024471055|nr:site-specific integrase [Comamonas terrigena]MDH1700614.1 site-specific integrase [Comamonas terrigena]